jgi:hypothetical protein
MNGRGRPERRIPVKTIDDLVPTLSKFPTEYARGRAAESALSAFASPPELLAALDRASETTAATRDAITLALITEHQRAAHPLWQSLLLVAYEPMFAGVRKRLRDKRDADARIVLAFLEAVAKVSLAHPPSLLALHLRSAVERSVFGTGAAAREEPATVSLEALRRKPGADDPEADVERAEQKRLLLAELDETFGAEAPDVLYVLLCARTGREQLVDLIADLYPALTSKARAAAYARLQRLRRRALVHLGERFGREAARTSSSAA